MRRRDRTVDDLALTLLLADAEAGLRVELGADAAGVLVGRTRHALTLAASLGAPVAPVLRSAIAADRDGRELQDAVRRASAEGRTVARALVLAPPLVAPVVASLVTDEPLAFAGTVVGRSVLGLAAVLWAAGALLVLLLVRSAARASERGRVRDAADDDELLELIAVALRAGLTLPAAVRTAAGTRAAAAGGGDAGRGGDATTLRAGDLRAALWLELGAAGPAPAGWARLGPALAGAARGGVAVAPVVDDLAARARAGRRQRALERAARLPARLTIPTALLLLPASLLVIGAPVVAGALQGLR